MSSSTIKAEASHVAEKSLLRDLGMPLHKAVKVKPGLSCRPQDVGDTRACLQKSWRQEV